MFWFLPLEIEDANAKGRKIPVANGVLIILNVLIFWLGWNPYVGQGDGLLSLFSMLTYAFGHADALHLIGNMWILLVFGAPVNRRLGNGLYLLAYLSAALFVGVCAWLFAPRGVLGASGAIFAVQIMCAFLFAGARIRIFYLVLFPFSVIAALLQKPASAVHWFIRWDSFHSRVLWWSLLFVPLLEMWHLLVGLRFGNWSWTHLGHLLGCVAGVAIVLMLPKKITVGRAAPAAAAF